MDVIDILREFIDTGVQEEELRSLVEDSIQAHIKLVKQAMANAVISARAAVLLDNLDGSTKMMAEARKLKKQYHHFLAELARLRGEPDPESGPDPDYLRTISVLDGLPGQ